SSPHVAGQMDLQQLEESGFVLGFVFAAQLAEDLLQQDVQPAALEEPFGRLRVSRFTVVAAVGVAEIDADEDAVASPLLSALPIALVGKEMLTGRQQKGAEASALAVGRRQRVFLQQQGE